MKRKTDPNIIKILESARSEYELMERMFILSQFTFPQAPSTDGIYRTYVPDNTKPSGRRQLSSSTLEGLKDKVYDYERRRKTTNTNNASVTDNSTYIDMPKYLTTVSEAFTKVMNEKLKYVKSPEARISVENTVCRNKSDFKRFIAGTEFEKMYVSDITKEDIENIIFLNLERYDLNEKGFATLKSVIKPIFDLAMQKGWIKVNPYAQCH